MYYQNISMTYLADLLQFSRVGHIQGTWALAQWCLQYHVGFL